MMTKINNLVSKLSNKDEGVTALEYALIAALIAVVIVIGVKAAGNNANTTFQTVANKMAAASN